VPTADAQNVGTKEEICVCKTVYIKVHLREWTKASAKGRQGKKCFYGGICMEPMRDGEESAFLHGRDMNAHCRSRQIPEDGIKEGIRNHRRCGGGVESGYVETEKDERDCG